MRGRHHGFPAWANAVRGDSYGPELIVNGGFETDGAGGADVFANWSEYPNVGTVTKETVLVHGGAAAAKCTAGASGGSAVAQYIVVQAAKEYELSFHYATDAANVPDFYCLDMSNGEVPAFESPILTISDGVYKKLTKRFTTPAGCLAVFLVMETVTNTAIAYFDDASLKQVNP
jgi:hypothetical protein